MALDDGTPIYVAGLVEWSDDLEESPVEVTGVLRRRASRVPPVPPGGEQVHGIGETYVLQDATWTPAG